MFDKGDRYVHRENYGLIHCNKNLENVEIFPLQIEDLKELM